MPFTVAKKKKGINVTNEVKYVDTGNHKALRTEIKDTFFTVYVHEWCEINEDLGQSTKILML